MKDNVDIIWSANVHKDIFDKIRVKLSNNEEWAQIFFIKLIDYFYKKDKKNS